MSRTVITVVLVTGTERQVRNKVVVSLLKSRVYGYTEIHSSISQRTCFLVLPDEEEMCKFICIRER